MNDTDPLSREDQAAFDALRRELDPPIDLEERVVKRLRTAGLLRRQHRFVRAAAVMAATLVIFAGGFAAGRAGTIARGPSPGQRYVLLLYGGLATSSEAEVARVAEYSAWARQEASAGRLLSGERLGDDMDVLGRAPSPSTELAEPAGFFIIRATSPADARATAAGCPHLRHGGTVVLKRIVDTGGKM